jgi:adenylate cyclase
MEYVDPQSGEAKLAAFRLVGFGGLGVIAEVAQAKAYEAVKKVIYRSILVASIVLCLSFLAGYLYSGTITWPIRQLAAAAERIANGDFKIELKPRGSDEVADLSLTFNHMALGLEERDRVKATFSKFHNKEIAEKLLSGEVKLGGERREATIFFSDVRGFTAMSESMEPEQVVEMLNEYMTRMVSIIRSHGGVVDKYVGDAIMALWGVPIGGPDDTRNAVRACLAMREELAKLNELRISRGQSALKIGMGLNVGPVIAGNIGSEEKMEYTVIGDAVNTASRFESMTKEYGTDLVVPKAIVDRVNDHFVFEQSHSIKVKGKSVALEVFKVLGYRDETGKEVIIQTPYSSYEAEKSDKVVHEEKPLPAAA